MGSFWVVSGGVWELLGSDLGSFWVVLGGVWELLGNLGAVLGGLGGILGDLRPAWVHFCRF